jgi:transposase
MAKELVTDELWDTIEPLLPPEPPRPQGRRPCIDNRAALTGIVFVLKSGIPWEMLPKELGCGSGMTCWRRLKEWQEAGVWERNKMPDFYTHRPRQPDQHEDWLKGKVRAEDG